MPEKSSTKHGKDQAKSKSSKPFKCDFDNCNKTFSTAGTKHRHAKEFHGMGERSVCSRCHESFTRNDKFKQHELGCEKTVECLTEYMKPRPGPYFDIQQPNLTSGPMPSLSGSMQPEYQDQVQRFTSFPPTDQRAVSTAVSSPMNNKQPSNGFSYNSNSTSAWSGFTEDMPPDNMPADEEA